MNHFAHLVLAQPTVESTVGNLLGDFARGVDQASLPAAVRAGLLNHRAVDRFTDAHPLVLEMKRSFGARRRRFAGTPAMVLVDSGYQTAIVYEQCRRRPTWAPARGHATLDKPYKDTTQDESRVGRALKGLRLWHHSNDVWKTWLHGRLRWPVDKMGAWYVLGEDEEYARQVTNERFRITRGKRDWYRTGNRENHYGDCEILAAIAADIQGVRRLRKPPPSFARPAAEEAPSRRGQHNPFARRPLGS